MRFARILFLLPALLAPVAPARSQTATAAEQKPFLSPMFSDHMVLQRGRAVPVWGWAAPGAQVTVSLNAKSAQAVAGPDGKWLARLPAMKAGGPYTVKVTSGPRSVALQDVLFGDVWLASGQSNMEMGIQAVNDAEKEIAAARYPEIRLYTVPHRTAFEPEWDPRGQWLACTPENIQKGTWAGFSAVAYFFGRDLYQRYKVPIGLIHSSWGGTPAEAWTSAEGLRAGMPEFGPTLDQVAGMRRRIASGTYDYERDLNTWITKNDPGSNASPGWESPAFQPAGWQTMNLPQHWEGAGLPNYDGVVWFRKEFDLPASATGKDAVLHLGAIDDGDTTWVNGVKVGATDNFQASRDYPVPASVLKPGRNVVAVRAWDFISDGGFWGKPEEMRLEIANGPTLPLSGAWLYNASVDIAKMGPHPQRLDADMPGTPTVLYNGMIAPVAPYAIKGIIWYQGEANAPNAFNYRRLLPTMIADWRRQFGGGDIPFLIVQLANFMARQPLPSESQWAELREAQTMTAQRVPKTGLALAIDIGDANDIHPKNKQEVGRRLALAAERIAYGDKKVVDSGPTFKSMAVEGSSIRLSFDNLGGGLVAKDGRLTGFAVAGADHRFVWADARIDGNTVVVTSPLVESPAAVRYAWADNPDATLTNKAGLPAVPFRTDGVHGETRLEADVLEAPRPQVPAWLPSERRATYQVTVRFTVAASGEIRDVRVLKSNEKRLNGVAIEAARKIKAKPAMNDGTPVDKTASWTYTFTVQ